MTELRNELGVFASLGDAKTPVGRNRGGDAAIGVLWVSAAFGSGRLGGSHAAAPMIVAAGYSVVGRRGETRVR
jgi:hypothetical protein